MRMEYQILIAFVLDLLLGDPRWLPHPVRGIGRLALSLETPLRKAIPCAGTAGVVAVLLTLSITGGVTYGIITLATFVHPLAGGVISIIILYTAFATRDLAQHAHRVYCALREENLEEARVRVGMIVGRDTDRLDKTGVIRATVETVSESLVDGVTAPLFFAAIGGPVGAMLYKAVNTLDSTFGYKNQRYLYFGWASARLDDVANWIPTRLTAPLLALVSGLFGLSVFQAIQMCWRDGGKHDSPNAGLSEATMAGALGVQLGGLNYYEGEPCDGPRFGSSVHPLETRHILIVNGLMLATASVALVLFLGGRIAVAHWLSCHGGVL